jgi:hypothetical protein
MDAMPSSRRCEFPNESKVVSIRSFSHLVGQSKSTIRMTVKEALLHLVNYNGGCFRTIGYAMMLGSIEVSKQGAPR